MCCTALTLAAVLVKCFVVISPDLHWLWDPRSPQGQTANTSMGPSGLAWLNSASVMLAAVAIGVHVMAGGRVARAASLLVLIGSAFCAAHMAEHTENLRLGGSWIAATSLALAALHLAQHDRPRRMIVAGLVALLVPLVIEATWYVWVDWPMTVQDYNQNRLSILRARGIPYGSVQQLLFERRLQSPEATGAFILGNVFGSVVAALTSLAGVVGVGLLAARQCYRAALPLVIAVGGLWTVFCTRSKGAAAALVLVAALVLLIGLIRRLKGMRLPLSALALTLVLLPIVAVLGRGQLGPPSTSEGERSVLFRHHYWQAAARMIGDKGPCRSFVGVGPAQFRQLYPRFKNPLNPEEITSTHNVVIDQVTMLGIGGLAWSVLLGTWLWQCGQRASTALGATIMRQETTAPSPSSKGVDVADLLWALLLALPVFVTQYAYQYGEFYVSSQLAWLAGVAGFVFVTVTLMTRGWLSTRWARLGLAAAALLVMVHNQIEMTFFLDGASAIAWVVVAVAAARERAARQRFRWMQLIVPSAFLVGSLAMVMVVAVPVTRQQRHLSLAAECLRRSNVGAAMDHLETAIAVLPTDPKPYESAAKIMLEQGNRKQAMSWLDRLEQNHSDEMWHLHIRIGLANWDVEEHGLSAVPAGINHTMREFLDRQPFSIQSHRIVADLKWQMSKHQEAADLYRRCLQLSDHAYLDPARQLTEGQRRHIQTRLVLTDR